MRTLDKILAAMGNVRAMERLHVGTYTESIINAIEEKPFAKSQNEAIYVSTEELGGFHYLKTIIIGRFHIKTTKGAVLTVKGKDFEFKLNTDMDEFESDFSNVSNTSITRIDFQIEAPQTIKFEKNQVNTLRLQAKKHDIIFEVH